MAHTFPAQDLLNPSDTFIHRHIGPSTDDIKQMLAAVGYDSLEALVDATVPANIRLDQPLNLGPPRGENELLAELRAIAEKNQIFRSLIGMGYYDCIVRRLSSGISSKIPAGTRSTHPIKPKFHRGGWKPCLTSRRWWPT